MAIAIERTRATVRGGESAEADVTTAPVTPKARTLTPDSACPGNCFGDLDYTGDADLYACTECGTVYHVPIAEHEHTCRFGCGRRTMECSYYGPPCEERLRIHRAYFGEPTPVLDEEEREDDHAREKTEHGIE